MMCRGIVLYEVCCCVIDVHDQYYEIFSNYSPWLHEVFTEFRFDVDDSESVGGSSGSGELCVVPSDLSDDLLDGTWDELERRMVAFVSRD